MSLVLFAGAFFLFGFPAALVALDEAHITDLESSPVFLLLAVCAPIPLIVTGLFCVYQGVVNAMRALSDRPIHYPLSTPFVK